MILQTVLESTRPIYNKELHIQGSFVWVSDFEIPYHNAEFINQVFTLARQHKITKCVWGGDALHLEAFSPFKGGDSDAEKEVAEIDEFLPGFLEPFEEIFWLVGNHDERLARRLADLGIRTTNEKALRMMVAPETVELFTRKVKISEYRFMRAGNDWLLEHPKNASVLPGRVAQQLTSKFHKHALVGHTHNVGKAMYNGYWAIETGHCLDSQRLAYNSQIHSTRPQMAQGAVLMIWHNQQYVPIDLTPQTIPYYLESSNLPLKNKSTPVTPARRTATRSKK